MDRPVGQDIARGRGKVAVVDLQEAVVVPTEVEIFA